MSLFCPEKNHPDWIKLESSLGSALAHYVHNANNGYPIHQTSDGAHSNLYQSLLEYHEGNETEAIRGKARTFGKSFKDWFSGSHAIDENGEPLPVVPDPMGEHLKFVTAPRNTEGVPTESSNILSYVVAESGRDEQGKLTVTSAEKVRTIPNALHPLTQTKDLKPDGKRKIVPQNNELDLQASDDSYKRDIPISYPESPIASLLNSIEEDLDADEPLFRVTNMDRKGEGVEFLNKLDIADSFSDQDPKTSKIITGTQDQADTINNQIREKKFGNDLSKVRKGEVLIDINGEDHYVTSVRPATKTIISPLKNEIDISGVNLETKTGSGKSKTVFLIDPESLAANAKELEYAQNYFDSTKEIGGETKELKRAMDTFYANLNVLGKDYQFGYAVTSDKVSKKYDNLVIHEDSIYQEKDNRKRNLSMHSALSAFAKKVSILSSRFFPRNQNINKPMIVQVPNVTEAARSKVVDRIKQTRPMNGKLLDNFSRLMSDKFNLNVVVISNDDIRMGNFPLSFLDKKGFAFDGTIYINSSISTIDTPMHEFSHVWLNAMEDYNGELHSKIVTTWAKSKFGDKVRDTNSNYSEAVVGEEAFAEWVASESGGSYDMFGSQNEYFNWISDKLSVYSEGASAEMSIGKLVKEMIDGGKVSGYFDNIHQANKEQLSDLYGTGYLNEKLQSIKDSLYNNKSLEKKC